MGMVMLGWSSRSRTSAEEPSWALASWMRVSRRSWTGTSFSFPRSSGSRLKMGGESGPPSGTVTSRPPRASERVHARISTLGNAPVPSAIGTPSAGRERHPGHGPGGLEAPGGDGVPAELVLAGGPGMGRHEGPGMRDLDRVARPPLNLDGPPP